MRGADAAEAAPEQVEAGYDAKNAYHNALHAADVMLTANGFLEHSGALAVGAAPWGTHRFALIVGRPPPPPQAHAPRSKPHRGFIGPRLHLLERLHRRRRRRQGR